MRHDKTHTHTHTHTYRRVIYIYIYIYIYIKCRSVCLHTRKDSSETVCEGKFEWVSLGNVVTRLWVGQPINFQGRDFYSLPKRPDRL